MENRFQRLRVSIILGWMLAFGSGVIYFLIHVMFWFQTPLAHIFLGYLVNYGLISGSIGGCSIALGLRSLDRLSLLMVVGLTLGWAVSLAIAFVIGWLLVGQDPNRLLIAVLIGMTMGGMIGGFLTGQVMRQVVPIALGQIWRVAIAWSLSLLIGNGIIYAIAEAVNRVPISGGFGWVVIGALLGGAIAGAMGSRTMIQQLS